MARLWSWLSFDRESLLLFKYYSDGNIIVVLNTRFVRSAKLIFVQVERIFMFYRRPGD